jgi:hypothetical protein
LEDGKTLPADLGRFAGPGGAGGRVITVLGAQPESKGTSMKLLNSRTAGFALIILFGSVMVFQLLLALGLPLTGAAWGGQIDTQPEVLRIASFVAGLILAFAILVVLEKMGIVHLIKRRKVINGILWFFAAYSMLNTVANLLSPGTIERFVMTPLALVASALCVVVARAPFVDDLSNAVSSSLALGESAEFVPKMPDRSLPLEFYIDTNRINARQGLPYMNQLEKWHRDRVIDLQMAEEAHDEAIKGNNPQRARKASSYIYSTVVPDMQAQYQSILKEIENIIFPSGAQTPSQENDVKIVFNAFYYMSILVTNDGGSSTQPNGILGNRDRLARFVQVMRDSEAVELVKERIRQRDERVRKVASMTGQPLPEWVDND